MLVYGPERWASPQHVLKISGQLAFIVVPSQESDVGYRGKCANQYCWRVSVMKLYPPQSREFLSLLAFLLGGQASFGKYLLGLGLSVSICTVKAAPSSECFLAALDSQIPSFLWGHPVLGGPHFWEAWGRHAMGWLGFCFPLVIILQTVGVENLALKNKTCDVCHWNSIAFPFGF